VEVLHISGGCLSRVTKERREFRWTAVGRRAFWFLFVAHKKELACRSDKPASEAKQRTKAD